MSVYTQSNPRRVDSLVAFRVWMDELLARRGVEVVSKTLANNRAAFMRAWGQPTCTFTGEYRHWIWVRRHGGTTFFVLTGRRGTGVEYAGATPIAESVTAVLDEILVAVTDAGRTCSTHRTRCTCEAAHAPVVCACGAVYLRCETHGDEAAARRSLKSHVGLHHPREKGTA